MTERISKSQRKRDLNELHKLGESLGKLNSNQLKTIPLTESLALALNEAKSITSNGAKKRHFQYIARIIRSLEPEEIDEIRTAFDNLSQSAAMDKAKFHEVEMWRDNLLKDDSKQLTKFINLYPQSDIQQLRQSINNARKEISAQKNLGSAKALFRLLKSIISPD